MTSYLDTLVDHERQTGLGAPTLDRITALVEALGNPHRAFRSIHVTGTNGKGSVAAAASALLRGRGLRVGTYGSPHVSALTERVALDGRPVPDESLERAVGLVRRAARSRGISPTWFEVITAAAFLLFAQARVEVAVVEVGMLGRWDATNVVRGDVAVVTNVGLDHTDLAGPTRVDVAREKAGIVEPGATLVLGEQDPRLRPLFEAPGPYRVLTAGRKLAWSHRRRSGISALVDLRTARGVYRDVPVTMPGRHQCDNVLLAVAAAEELLDAPLDAPSVRRELAGLWS